MHKIKGTNRGIQYALDALGIHAEFVDWFEAVPEAKPGTHEITAYVSDQLFPGHQLLNPKTVRQIWRLINEMKRWSQKTDLKVGERFESETQMRVCTHPQYMDQLDHDPMPPAETPQVEFASSMIARSEITHTIEGRAA